MIKINNYYNSCSEIPSGDRGAPETLSNSSGVEASEQDTTTKKIIVEHIPRTIFGVRYNMKVGEHTTIINMLHFVETKGQQDKLIIKLNKKPETYSEVTPLKWMIKGYGVN
jgi:hypothetical protein